jgi:hypothetical protein
MLLFTPHPVYYKNSPRDQYLRQLIEDASCELNSSELMDNNYYSRRPAYPSYEELQRARLREYCRRQEAARQDEMARRAAALERYKQQRLELERRGREQRHLDYMNAIRIAQPSYNWTTNCDSDSESEEQGEEVGQNVSLARWLYLIPANSPLDPSDIDSPGSHHFDFTGAEPNPRAEAQSRFNHSKCLPKSCSPHQCSQIPFIHPFFIR